jgi:hypothetical protein
MERCERQAGQDTPRPHVAVFFGGQHEKVRRQTPRSLAEPRDDSASSQLPPPLKPKDGLNGPPVRLMHLLLRRLKQGLDDSVQVSNVLSNEIDFPLNALSLF